MTDNTKQTWSHGEYMLWLNNSEASHFGAHAIVATMLAEDDATIGRAILAAFPPREFSASIDPDQVDPATIGRALRADREVLGY